MSSHLDSVGGERGERRSLLDQHQQHVLVGMLREKGIDSLCHHLCPFALFVLRRLVH